VGQTNAKIARWQRVTQALSWFLAVSKTLVIAFTSDHVRIRFLFTAFFMLVAAGAESWAVSASCKHASRYYWFHEHYKAYVEMANLMACLVCIIMLQPDELAFNTPLAFLALRAWTITIDQIRLHTAVKVYAVEFGVFLLMMFSSWYLGRAPYATAKWGDIITDLVKFLTYATILPIVLGITMEAQLRQGFLQEHERSLDNLGAFWRGYIAWCDRLERWAKGVARGATQGVLGSVRQVAGRMPRLERFLDFRLLRQYMGLALCLAVLAALTMPSARSLW
jgi:hypothetical protein